MTEFDAVRLAERLNVDARVHALLTRQHVTSHVRDNTTETERTARKSGVRRVTTRVVHQTTTITRGETMRTSSETGRAHSHHSASASHSASERDVSVFEQRVAVPAIEYRARPKKAKVMRRSVSLAP